MPLPSPPPPPHWSIYVSPPSLLPLSPFLFSTLTSPPLQTIASVFTGSSCPRIMCFPVRMLTGRMDLTSTRSSPMSQIEPKSSYRCSIKPKCKLLKDRSCLSVKLLKGSIERSRNAAYGSNETDVPKSRGATRTSSHISPRPWMQMYDGSNISQSSPIDRFKPNRRESLRCFYSKNFRWPWWWGEAGSIGGRVPATRVGVSIVAWRQPVRRRVGLMAGSIGLLAFRRGGWRWRFWARFVAHSRRRHCCLLFIRTHCFFFFSRFGKFCGFQFCNFWIKKIRKFKY